MKKIFSIMAMFSMVAMMAACGGGKDEEDNNDNNKAPDATDLMKQAQDFAQKACNCNGDTACINQVMAEMNEAFKDVDSAELVKLNEEFNNKLAECTPVVEEEELPEEEPAKAKTTKKTTKKATTEPADATQKTTKKTEAQKVEVKGSDIRKEVPVSDVRKQNIKGGADDIRKVNQTTK